MKPVRLSAGADAKASEERQSRLGDPAKVTLRGLGFRGPCQSYPKGPWYPNAVP